MPTPLRVLVVEDMEDDALLLVRELQRAGWEVTHQRVDTAAALHAALETQVWDMIVSDYSMPQFSGSDALTVARQHARAVDVPFILVSGTVGEEIAVKAMKAGANDYLFKGNLKRLAAVTAREIREADVRREGRRVASELHTRERQLAEAQRLACLGSWHLDVVTNVVIGSEETARILGLPDGKFSLTFGEFMACIPAEDRNLFVGPLHTAAARQFAVDLRIVRPGGVLRYVHLRGDIVRNEEGNPVEAGGMIQDITERKVTEQELRQALDELAVARDSAEAASRAKDQFLAILSHELRTPLTPIRALISFWEGNPDLPEELRHHISIMHRNVDTEVRLIDDLLDLTAIVRDKIELHFEVTDVHAVVRHAIQSLQNEIDTKKLRLSIELEAGQHHVWADAARLQQVFLNLLANAVKFTHAGGHVTVRSSNDDHGCWQLQIIDTGIGIEADVLPRLFKSFEQGERTITRRFGGLGLGLSIAKSLVEMHKGQISATSDGLGKGTTLSVALDTIPAEVEMEAVAPRPARIAPTTAPSSRVLLVEDHDDTRHIMTRLLRELGCAVTTAETVSGAIELVGQQEFDVLVSDVGLPDGSGTDIMEFIKNRYPIRGIAVSGFGQEDDLRRSREAGFATHLTKPLDLHALQAALENVAV